MSNVTEAVAQAKKQSKDRNFIETVELAINLKNIDLKKPENRISLEIPLPHPLTKKTKIAIIAEGDLALRAKENADLVIQKNDLERYATDKRAAKNLADKYDFFIAQADLMPTVGKILGPALGVRGKMPQVVPPTVADLEPIFKRMQKTIRMRLRQNPVFFAKVGTKDMSDKEISENIESILKAVEDKLEKGHDNIRSLYVKTTMGPPVKIEI
ncbi:MAG: 50S ribosomal protein L1 [Promethearchaeota archaeon]